MNLAEMLAVADQATQGIEVKSGDFELVPPGTYDVTVTAAEGPLESKRTNPTNPAEHGQYLKIELTITGPSHAGRKVWMNNNIICYPHALDADSVRKSQTAMAMGAKERKVMLDSLGKAGISMAEELVGASFKATVATEKGTNGYADKSVVKTVRPSAAPAPSAAPSATPSVVPSATPTPAPARAKMPWEK